MWISRLGKELPRQAGVVGALSAILIGLAACLSQPTESGIVEAEIETDDQQSIFAAAHGDPANPPLVFIHGWSLSQLVWREQVKALSADFYVLTYDLRGHGRSSRPETSDAFMERWVHARDLEKVLNHFGVSRCATLVGWSFGAIVASDAGVHLGRDQVCGLVLVSGTIEANTEAGRARFGPLMAELGALTSEGPEADEEEAVERFLKDSRLIGDWDPDHFADLEAVTSSLSPKERRTVVARPSYNNAEGLNNTGLPVLLIHGSDDPVLLLATSKAASEELEYDQLQIYQGIGHWPFLEEIERFNEDVAAFARSSSQSLSGEPD